jgi:hypothetical protein
MAICCAAFAAPGLATAESISGTVRGADTHAGVPGVWVCAGGHPFPPERCANADSEGRYRIDGLQAAGYEVRFDATNLNYIEQSRWVDVGPGQEVEDVDAELQVGGRISGRVTDVETGLPLEHMEVCAPGTNDSAEFRTIYCDRTDAAGEYLIQALAPGHYRIEFGTYPGGLQQLNYIHQYFPGKPRRDEAVPQPLFAGTTLPNIDAAMQRGVEIAGAVTDSAGAPVVWQSRICALDAGSEAIVQCTFPEQEGLYRIAGLPFGSYKVSFGVDVEDEPGLVLHPDGFVPQYYNGKPTFAAADVLSGPGPTVIGGIDARLARGDDPTEPRPEPVLAQPSWQPPPVYRKPPLRCKKKGFKKRRVRGKPRCVKVHKRKHHRTRAGAGAKRR